MVASALFLIAAAGFSIAGAIQSLNKTLLLIHTKNGDPAARQAAKEPHSGQKD